MSEPNTHGERPAPSGTPLWVKVFGVLLALVVVALVVVFVIGGGHGPGRHGF